MKPFLLIPVILALLACGVTETGNPELVDVDLQMRATTSQPADVALEPTAGVQSVATAWFSVDRVVFVRGQVCDGPGEEEFEITGPWIVDANSPLPQGITATLPADGYCRVRLRLGRATSTGDAPANLAGHAVLVTGERADGVPFEIRSRREEDADIRAMDPITLSEATAKLSVAVDVATWLGTVDLDSGIPSNGVVRIDDDNNDDLLDDVEDALERALELFDDSNDSD